MAARHHTTLNLDATLVQEAQCVLGTKNTTETIHQALQEVVHRDKRRQLIEMGIGNMTPALLEEMRENYSFEEARRAQESET